MAWAEKMARELKKRDNQSMGPYIEGTVVSTSPLRVSIYDGAAILPQAQLRRIDPHLSEAGSMAELAAGQKVLLIGQQIYYIIGVVTDA